MPQSGTLHLWQMPDTLRVEHAQASGAQIAPFYDSMIAKIISHGSTREEARRKLLLGVQDAVALGVRTNQAFLGRCLSHPVFAAGGATTGFIARHLDELLQTDADTRTRADVLAAALLLETAHGARPPGSGGRRLTHNLPLNVHFECNGARRLVALEHQAQHRYTGECEGRQVDIDLIALGAGRVRFTCNGVMESAVYTTDGARLLLRYRGLSLEVQDLTRAAAACQDSRGASDGRLRAAMNGRVVAVLVAVGDRVEAGQPMLTLEAMKMEHVHTAPVAGTVRTLTVAPGEQVPASRVVAEIEAHATGVTP
jgi:geranyl-CoA carboxylase alpha subunit